MDYNQYSHKVLTSLVLVPNPIVYSIIAAIKRPVKEDYSTTIGKRDALQHLGHGEIKS